MFFKTNLSLATNYTYCISLIHSFNSSFAFLFFANLLFLVFSSHLTTLPSLFSFLRPSRSAGSAPRNCRHCPTQRPTAATLLLQIFTHLRHWHISAFQSSLLIFNLKTFLQFANLDINKLRKCTLLLYLLVISRLNIVYVMWNTKFMSGTTINL